MEILTENEKQILSALYQHGNLTVSKLSKVTLINRTSLYPMLSKLQEKGLVSTIQTEGTTVLQPIDKGDFTQWVKRQEKNYQAATGELMQWVHDQKDSNSTLMTSTKFYEGHEAIKSLYADSWRKNPDKEILALTDYEKAYETMGEFFRQEYFEDRVKRGVHVKSLLPPSDSGRHDIDKANDLLRDMRFIDLFKGLGIELNIYGDSVSVVAFDDKKPTGILLKNDIIAKAFKQIFSFLWKQANAPK